MWFPKARSVSSQAQRRSELALVPQIGIIRTKDNAPDTPHDPRCRQTAYVSCCSCSVARVLILPITWLIRDRLDIVVGRNGFGTYPNGKFTQT